MLVLFLHHHHNVVAASALQLTNHVVVMSELCYVVKTCMFQPSFMLVPYMPTFQIFRGES